MSDFAPVGPTGGEAVVAALVAHGVTTIFGIPGTHNLGLFAAMASHGIEVVTTRHEQGAGYAADGYARASGGIGVVVTTTGPAALNAAAALAQAHSDSVPVLLVSPGMPTGHPAHGNGLLHETRDQVGVFASLLDQAHRVESVAEIPAAVAQTIALMTQGRPRPAYLEIPLDLLDARAPAPVITPLSKWCAAPAPREQVERATRLLRAGRRRVIVAGGGAGSAARELRRVAEALGAPVVTTTNGKAALSEDHPLSLGAGVQLPTIRRTVEDADVVLAVGTEFASSDWWNGPPRIKGALIRIDIDPVGLLANLTPDVPLLGEAASVLEDLARGIAAAPPIARGDELDVEALRRLVVSEQRASASTWLPALESLDAALPASAVVAADNAMAAYNGAIPLLRLRRPRAMLFPTGLGTLGFGMAAGIGAKIASPETPVVVLQGDGGLMFTLAELATAAQRRMALPVVVFDNGGYGEIGIEMADRGDAVHGVSLGSPDFVALAEAMGCHGIAVHNQSNLGQLVRQALDADRPTLLHLVEDSRATQTLAGGLTSANSS